MNETTSLSVGAWLRARMPAPWREAGFLLENWQWIGLGGVLLSAWVVSRLVRAVAASIGRRIFVRFVPGGDVGTVRAHLDALQEPVRSLYAALGREALELARPQLDALTVEQLNALLR